MIISSVLNLLAFLLAFTFGLAQSHFDTRSEALHDEAIAIGTAFHRADLLPEPRRTQLRSLIRQYVDLRLEASRSPDVEKVIPRLRQLQERIWTEAIGTGKNESGAIPPPILLQSLNDMIDVQSERVQKNMRARIPRVVWGFLSGAILISIAAAGYHSGLMGNRRRSFASLAYALVFAAVAVMIADADSPRFGQFETDHEALHELQARLHVAEP
jgi:hypothetical protein